MRINNVNSTNFGAIPTKQTKTLLKSLMNDGIDISNSMAMMKEICATDYITTTPYGNGYRVDIYDVQETRYGTKIGYLKKNIAVISDREPSEKAAKKILDGLLKAKASRSQEQINSDFVENFFVREA